jgi:hypothetical protein
MPIAIKSTHSLFAGLTEQEAALVTSAFLTLVCSIMFVYLGEVIWSNSAYPRIAGVRRESWVLLTLISLFPQHFFFLTGYPEALFLLLFGGGILAVWLNKWVTAAVFLSLTPVTRPQGIWILGIVGAFLILGAFRQRIERRQAIAALGILPLPFFSFLYWNWSKTGDVLYFLHEQKKWGRAFDPASGLLLHLPRYDDSRFLLYSSIGLALYFFQNKTDSRFRLLCLLTIVFAEVPVFYGGFYSYPRLMAVNLGLFILCADFFSEKTNLFLIWCLWSLTRLGVQALTYTSGGWAG